MASWHPFDGNGADSVGGNTATLFGAATFAPGMVGSALQLNGSAATYARTGASTGVNLATGSGMTIDAWINPSDLSAARAIVEWSTDSAFGTHF